MYEIAEISPRLDNLCEYILKIAERSSQICFWKVAWQYVQAAEVSKMQFQLTLDQNNPVC
jgi:hypothetical protein